MEGLYDNIGTLIAKANEGSGRGIGRSVFTDNGAANHSCAPNCDFSKWTVDDEDERQTLLQTSESPYMYVYLASNKLFVT